MTQTIVLDVDLSEESDNVNWSDNGFSEHISALLLVEILQHQIKTNVDKTLYIKQNAETHHMEIFYTD